MRMGGGFFERSGRAFGRRHRITCGFGGLILIDIDAEAGLIIGPQIARA